MISGAMEADGVRVFKWSVHSCLIARVAMDMVAQLGAMD